MTTPPRGPGSDRPPGGKPPLAGDDAPAKLEAEGGDALRAFWDEAPLLNLDAVGRRVIEGLGPQRHPWWRFPAFPPRVPAVAPARGVRRLGAATAVAVAALAIALTVLFNGGDSAHAEVLQLANALSDQTDEALADAQLTDAEVAELEALSDRFLDRIQVEDGLDGISQMDLEEVSRLLSAVETRLGEAQPEDSASVESTLASLRRSAGLVDLALGSAESEPSAETGPENGDGSTEGAQDGGVNGDQGDEDDGDEGDEDDGAQEDGDDGDEGDEDDGAQGDEAGEDENGDSDEGDEANGDGEDDENDRGDGDREDEDGDPDDEDEADDDEDDEDDEDDDESDD